MFDITVIWNDSSFEIFEDCNRATFDFFCALGTVYAVSLYQGGKFIETQISRFAS